MEYTSEILAIASCLLSAYVLYQLYKNNDALEQAAEGNHRVVHNFATLCTLQNEQYKLQMRKYNTTDEIKRLEEIEKQKKALIKNPHGKHKFNSNE